MAVEISLEDAVAKIRSLKEELSYTKNVQQQSINSLKVCLDLSQSIESVERSFRFIKKIKKTGQYRFTRSSATRRTKIITRNSKTA